MKRREFITGSLAASALAGVSSLSVAAEKGQSTVRDYYELRAYRLTAGADHKLLESYLENAAIPAWNRLGIKEVGLHKVQGGCEYVSAAVGAPKRGQNAIEAGERIAAAESV